MGGKKKRYCIPDSDRNKYRLNRNVPKPKKPPQCNITPPPIPKDSLEDSPKSSPETAPLTAINLFIDKILEDDAENNTLSLANELRIPNLSHTPSYNISKRSCLVDSPRCRQSNIPIPNPQPSVFATNVQEPITHQEDSKPPEFPRVQKIRFSYNENTSDHLHKAKNLYNFALLNVRQLFLAIENENEEINNNNNYFGLADLIRIYKKGLDRRKTGNLSEEEIRSRFESLKRNVRFKNWDSVYKNLVWLFKYHKDYTSLSYSVVSQQVLRRLKDEIASFGKKLKLYWKGKLKGRPSLPKYLPKDGERGIVYPKQMLDLKGVRQRMDAGRYKSTEYNTHTIPVPIPNKDLDKFPPIRMDFSIFKSIDDFFNRLKEVRIRPEGNYYMCDVVYSIGPRPKDYDLSNTRVLAIDFGSNNFVTTVNNIEKHPELIKAKYIKKANFLIDSQYRELQSEFDCLNHIKYQHSRRQTPILEAIEKGINIIKERRDNLYGVKGKKRNPRLVELQNLIDDLTDKLTEVRFELRQNKFYNSQNKVSLNFPDGNTFNSEQFASLEYKRLKDKKVKLEKNLKHSLANKKYIISKYNEKISVYSRIMDSLLVLPADQYFHYITERMVYIKKQFLDIFAYRNRLITDRLHKISRYLINYCLIHKIGVIIVGYNVGWKQNGSIGKKNNRIFQKLPHSYFLEKLKYKAKYFGIRVIEINEFNTSRCSALDLESLNKKSNFMGQRGLRIDPKSKDPKSRSYYTHSLFKSEHYGIIHSDVNGGLNIARRSAEFRKCFKKYILAHRESNRKIFNPKKVKSLDNALKKQNQHLLIQV